MKRPTPFFTTGILLSALFGCSSGTTGGSGGEGGGSPGTTATTGSSAVTSATSSTSTSASAATGTASSSTSTGGASDCTRGTIEGDFESTAPVGAGVDAATGKLAPLPSTAVMSTTYLALRPGAAAQKRFGELVGPVQKALETQPGLLAVELGTSTACGTARTLTVWQDEAAMLGFVMGDAHAAAAANVGDVSRGGSATISWATTSVSDASWQSAAKRLGDVDGPLY